MMLTYQRKDKMDKIQFIVCGWWYDEFDKKTGQTDFIKSLQYLKKFN